MLAVRSNIPAKAIAFCGETKRLNLKEISQKIRKNIFVIQKPKLT